jgi:hypothetical protein
VTGVLGVEQVKTCAKFCISFFVAFWYRFGIACFVIYASSTQKSNAINPRTNLAEGSSYPSLLKIKAVARHLALMSKTPVSISFQRRRRRAFELTLRLPFGSTPPYICNLCGGWLASG